VIAATAPRPGRRGRLRSVRNATAATACRSTISPGARLSGTCARPAGTGSSCRRPVRN